MTATGNQIRRHCSGIRRGVQDRHSCLGSSSYLKCSRKPRMISPRWSVQLIAEQLEQFTALPSAQRCPACSNCRTGQPGSRLWPTAGAARRGAASWLRAYLASIGNGHQFHKGREVSAWLGLVPRQSGTGVARSKLLGHDQERRSLPAHDAHPWSPCRDHLVAQQAKRHWPSGSTPMVVRRGMNKTVVALANKDCSHRLADCGQRRALRRQQGVLDQLILPVESCGSR